MKFEAFIENNYENLVRLYGMNPLVCFFLGMYPSIRPLFHYMAIRYPAKLWISGRIAG